MRRLLMILVGLAVLGFAGCVEKEDIAKLNPIGKVYEGSIVFRNMELPLPEGKWVVVGRGYAHSNNYVQICLNKVVDNKIHEAVFITRDAVHTKYTGYHPFKTLKRTNMLYVEAEKNVSGRGQDGWFVNHYRLAFSKNDSKANKESLQYIKDNKLVLPGNFVYTGHLFSGKSARRKYLSYSHFRNPEVDGIAPPKNAEWASSDWNILKINAYPEKLAYVEKIKAEGAEFHKKLRAAFGG